MRICSITALLLLLIVPVSLQANEGEDHTALETATVPAHGSDLQVLGATTEQFEVVIKYPLADPSDEIQLTLFLSDAPTNAPVAGAQVEIQIPDAQVNLTMSPTETPGIYGETLMLPRAGVYDLIVTVTAGERIDLIPLSGLRVGKEGDKEGHQSWGMWGIWLGITLVAITLVGVIWRRAKRKEKRRINHETADKFLCCDSRDTNSDAITGEDPRQRRP